MASAAEQLASNLNFSTFAKAEDLKKRLWFIVPAVVVIMLLLPLAASAAITDSQVIAILNAGITGLVDGLVDLVKLAYCASGVAVLC